jgi:hypothetical protein
METKHLQYKIKLVARTLNLEIQHGYFYATVKINGKYISTRYFVGQGTFTVLLSDTYLLIKVALTGAGYKYTVESTHGEVVKVC